MAKPALKKPAAAAAKPAPKLAGGAKPAAAAKPGKALAKPAKTATPPEPKTKVGDIVEFVGYQNREEGFEPLFEAGDRLEIMDKKKDTENGLTFFAAVKEEDADAYRADADSVNGDQIYPAEFKKAEKLAADPFAITLVENANLDATLAEHDGDPLEAAKAMQEQAEKATFYLGGFLAMLYSNRKYLEYGEGEGDTNPYADDKDDAGNVVKLSGWDKFTKENFNEGGRKCVEIIGTYQAIMATGLDADAIEEIATDKKIGWVKLAYIKGVVTKDNVEELVTLARDNNVADFKESVKTDYMTESGEARSGGTGGGAKVKRTVVKVAFFEDQAAGVQYVLSQAAKEMGVAEDALNQILERIILDWGQQNLGETIIKKARSEKKKVLKNLKAGGVDTKERVDEDTALEEFLSRGEAEVEAEANA